MSASWLRCSAWARHTHPGLGPGIIALGQGDTQTLSTSLLTAFDTTIAGLCAAAVCLVVTTLRKRWYGGYMADLETLMDCVCEEEAA